MNTNNTPIQKGKLHLSFIVISLFLSVLVVFKTSITIYMKWKKKKTVKKQTNKKKSVMVFVFYFALVLHNSSGWNTICIGERIKIIYKYIIKNLKYRKMHTHVDSYA